MPSQCEAHSLDSQPNTEPFNAELRSIYIDFLHRMGFENSAEACAPVSRRHITDAITHICGSYVRADWINSGAGFPSVMCKDRPLEQQVTYGHFTTLCIAVEETGRSLTGGAKDKYLEDVALFQMKMSDPNRYAAAYPGRGDLHPLLEGCMHYLRSEQNPFYLAYPRTLTIVVKAFLDFLEACMLEEHYQVHPMNYVPEMRLFSNFLRMKTGIAEAFACFLILPDTGGSSPMVDDRFYYNTLYPLIPELIDVFNLLNDVLSFYKEAEDGETDNTIVINAKVKKQSHLDAIRETTEYLEGQRHRIMAILDQSGSLEWKKRIQQFYQGYMSWHLGSARYRLKQVLGDWYQGEYWT